MSEKGMRYELKYEISRPALEMLTARLRGAMRTDRHAGANGYTIRSLYFDDIDRSAYRDKIDGVRDRSKLRLRCYNGDTKYLVLENKEKLGNLTRKTGERVTLETARRLTAGESPGAAGGETLLLYEALRRSAGLRPAVIVEYDRLPFVYPVSNVRVTLDMNVRTVPGGTDLFDFQRLTVPVLDEGTAILEVKFDSFLPEYLAGLLNDVPKTRIAVSKYVKCLGISC